MALAEKQCSRRALAIRRLYHHGMIWHWSVHLSPLLALIGACGATAETIPNTIELSEGEIEHAQPQNALQSGSRADFLRIDTRYHFREGDEFEPKTLSCSVDGIQTEAKRGPWGVYWSDIDVETAMKLKEGERNVRCTFVGKKRSGVLIGKVYLHGPPILPLFQVPTPDPYDCETGNVPRAGRPLCVSFPLGNNAHTHGLDQDLKIPVVCAIAGRSVTHSVSLGHLEAPETFRFEGLPTGHHQVECTANTRKELPVPPMTTSSKFDVVEPGHVGRYDISLEKIEGPLRIARSKPHQHGHEPGTFHNALTTATIKLSIRNTGTATLQNMHVKCKAGPDLRFETSAVYDRTKSRFKAGEMRTVELRTVVGATRPSADQAKIECVASTHVDNTGPTSSERSRTVSVEETRYLLRALKLDQ